MMLNNGYKNCHANRIFSVKRNDLYITTFIFYVNDIVVIGGDLTEVERLKKHPHSKCEIKDLGELTYLELKLQDHG